MLASSIVYFSLFSASWMSVVSALLDGPQTVIMNRFRYRLVAGHSLAVAVYLTEREAPDLFHDALEVYCTWQIGMLNEHVNYYITHRVDPNINHGIHQAPPRVPAFSLVWNELPYIVYWIRYMNLRIVNGLNLDIIRRGLPLSPLSMLTVIDDAYVMCVSNKYGNHNYLLGNEDPYEDHITNIAVQYAMNKEILLYNQSGTALRARLQRYQTMILALHAGMARYMQIETRLRNDQGFTALENQIQGLSDIGVRGYGHSHVKHHVEIVSQAILSVIAVYGIRIYEGLPIPFGTEMICDLLITQRAVRHFIRPDLHRYIRSRGDLG
jgi:hypothetical protein